MSNYPEAKFDDHHGMLSWLLDAGIGEKIQAVFSIEPEYIANFRMDQPITSVKAGKTVLARIKYGSIVSWDEDTSRWIASLLIEVTEVHTMPALRSIE